MRFFIGGLIGLLLGIFLTVMGSILDWPMGWFGNIRKLVANIVKAAGKVQT